MQRGIIAASILVVALLIGSTIANVSPAMPVLLLASVIIFFVTLVRTDLGLAILIISMLLSPELKIADVPERAVVVRVDDILLFIVFFTWLAKMAIHKKFGLLKPTPLNLPMASYIIVCVLFSARGAIVADLNPLRALFYILKFIEYFMLYFMFTNNITSKRQIKMFIKILLITCAVICIYSLVQIAGGAVRPTAPFEGEHGEPNTLAGYLMLISSVIIGLLIYTTVTKQKFILGGLLALVFICLLFTLSRSSYVAFIIMYLTIMIMTKKGKIVLFSALVLTVILTPLLMPPVVKHRVMQTFELAGKFRRTGTDYVANQYGRYQKLNKPALIEQKVFGKSVVMEASAAARIYHWRYGIKRWKESPFFGHGITGITFIDSQYFRILGELGAIGFIVFSWLLITIFRETLRAFQVSKDNFSKGICLGFLGGYVGLLVHALAVNTFIIVRIMEPFWFLAAVVMRLPQIESQGEE